MPGKLKDIAEILGLSVSTVSRVLNGKGHVSTETKEKILRTAKEINYRPDENAKSLKTNTTSIIGVIVPDITNMFYAKLVKSIEDACKDLKYTVLLCNTDENPALENGYYQLLRSQRAFGMVIVPVGNDIYYDDNFDNIVFVDNIPNMSKKFSCITIDNFRAAYELTAYLYSKIPKKRKKLAVIMGPEHETSSKLRLMGIQSYLNEMCADDCSLKVYEGNFKYDGGYNCMMQIIGNGELPDAVITLNNHLAYGALAVMRENSIDVPGQIKLACFDAIDDMKIISPKITCILQPVEEFGKLAVNLLKNGNELEMVKIEKILLDYEFVHGESC